MRSRSYGKRPLLLFNFNRHFSKTSQYKISRKCVQRFLSWDMRRDGQKGQSCWAERKVFAFSKRWRKQTKKFLEDRNWKACDTLGDGNNKQWKLYD
jgi:hypothetical protein